MPITKYSGEEPTNGISYNLWNRLGNWRELLTDPSSAYSCWEDFSGFGLSAAVASNVGRYAGASGSWKSYEDTSTGFSNILTGGVLEYDGTTTDNLEGAIQRNGTPFVIAASGGKPMAFEAIVAKEVITDTLGYFIGLAQGASPGNSFIADAGNDIADVSALGFFSMDTDGDQADFIYQDSGDAFAVAANDFATLVAATYVKLGFFYDGTTITPYLNGVEYPESKITAATIAAATFPSADQMSPIFAVKQGNNVDNYVRCAGIYCIQRR
jgi:hypothetical protein